MTTFNGKWYDGKTSTCTDVVCLVNDKGAIRVERLGDGHLIAQRSGFDITVTARLADTPRYLQFPDGGKLETGDNDAVDEAVRNHGRASWLGAVHQLETRLKFVLPALALMLIFLWSSMTYGIPAAAKFIAFRLPPSILDFAAQQAIDVLDASFVGETGLDTATMDRLEDHFASVLEEHSHLRVTVAYRKGGAIGPNAFALPDGTIIFTDEMVEMAVHDDELGAVLVHEIGHIVHRHSLRTVIQDSLLGFVLLAITGDAAGSSELFLGIPVLLTEMAYSRGFEQEADQYALSYMRRHGQDTTHFANLMRRIEKKIHPHRKDRSRDWLNYLSTHPLTEERIEAFKTDPGPP